MYGYRGYNYREIEFMRERERERERANIVPSLKSMRRGYREQTDHYLA
jgi:hypothetical protein